LKKKRVLGMKGGLNHALKMTTPNVRLVEERVVTTNRWNEKLSKRKEKSECKSSKLKRKTDGTVEKGRPLPIEDAYF